MATFNLYINENGVDIPGVEFVILELFVCVERRTRKSAIKRLFFNGEQLSESQASMCIYIAEKFEHLLENEGVQGNLKISEKGREQHAEWIHWNMTRATRSVGADSLADILCEMDALKSEEKPDNIKSAAKYNLMP